MAKGALRPRSSFAGKLDLFFEAEIQIVRSRKSSLHTLTEVSLRNVFAGIRRGYARTQTASYFVELIELCTERDHREPALYDLLRRALAYVDSHEPDLRALAHFESEVARITGVHSAKRAQQTPAIALGALFGKLPVGRAALLKALRSNISATGEVPMRS